MQTIQSAKMPESTWRTRPILCLAKVGTLRVEDDTAHENLQDSEGSRESAEQVGQGRIDALAERAKAVQEAWPDWKKRWAHQLLSEPFDFGVGE